MGRFIKFIFLGLLIGGFTVLAPKATAIGGVALAFTSGPALAQKGAPPNFIAPQVDLHSQPLFRRAKEANPERYRFAVNKGARFVPTPDGRSFYVLWTPKDFPKAPVRPMIITLHGHASWAFDEFFLWQPYAEERGYGIIALQWWFGGGEATRDYYSPYGMYPIFEQALRDQGIAPGMVLLHGYSRGSANSYALTALDRQHGRFIGLTISNAGGMAQDFPPNVDIFRGRFGAAPFKGVHWVMYCGGKDPHPHRDGCEAMERARALVTRYGATVDLFINDPTGEHGGFHRRPANVNQALDVFDKVIKRGT
ncbi:MAG: hypothetical protein N2509_07310 [Treponemataceae bacterium]|nr:hypothetical protein [Treponemataceae bacterium]